MEQKRLPHVLLIYRFLIPSIRLCGHCQMEELARRRMLEYRTCQEMKITKNDLNWADIVLLGRLDSWYEYQLARILKKAGKYLIYIIDDDLLNVPPEISSASYYSQKEIQEYIRTMIEMSDAILSPSPRLLEKYAVNGRKAIQIEEPAIDPVPYEPHDPNKPVKIGFAGSIDRAGDIDSILSEALKEIKREFGDQVEFEFFGAIPGFAQEIGAKTIPYCDSYDEYRKKLNDLKWDIGLAPMPDTPFHACKHYNKFVEYGAAGVLGVFSDVEPYKRIKERCQFVAFCQNNKKEWFRVLSELVSCNGMREQKRKSTCEYMLMNMQTIHTADQLMDSLNILGITDMNKDRKGVFVFSIKFIGLIEFMKKCISFIKRYNFMAFQAALLKIRNMDNE